MISLLFYKLQIVIIRPILPVFPSCPLYLWWPIQVESNCEYSSEKGKQCFFITFPSFYCPASHYYIWTLWGCPAYLCPLWFFSSAFHEIPSVEIGINLKWMNRKWAIICAEVISCEAPCIITVTVPLFHSVSVTNCRHMSYPLPVP